MTYTHGVLEHSTGTGRLAKHSSVLGWASQRSVEHRVEACRISQILLNDRSCPQQIYRHMQFGGDSSPTSLSPKNRRALRENRSLQDGAADAGVASAMFELAVEIVPVDTKSAASSSRGLFAMAVAVAAGAMLVF